jgi:O-antigen/teichoic acid export membrane protein
MSKTTVDNGPSLISSLYKPHVAAKGKLLRDVLETYGTRVILIAIGLAVTVIGARVLGPVGRGLFAVATAIGAIGVQFGNLGLHASNTYYVAKNRDLLPALVGNTLVISFGVGGFGAVLVWIVFSTWPSLAPLRGSLLVLALAGIPFGLAYLLLQNLLLGIQQLRAYNQIELVSKSVGLALICLVVYVGQTRVEAIFTATLAALMLSCLWVLWRLRGFLRSPAVPSWAVFTNNIGLGMKAYLIAFFGFLLLRIDLLIVKYLIGPKPAGYYSISETMAENMLTLPVVLGTILFPKLSEMICNEEKLELTKKVALVTVVLMAPMIAIASVFAKPLVHLAFGEAFLPAVPAFVWLMPGTFFLGIEIVLVQYLNSLGFPRVIVLAWLLVALLNIGTNLWAIPAYGITGAAIVSTVSYFLIFIVVLLLIERSARVHIVLNPTDIPVYNAD